MAEDKKPSAVGLDAILAQLGFFGKFNFVNYGLLVLPIFLAGIYGSIYVFEASDINYRCKIPQCENQDSKSWMSYAIPMENEQYSRCKRYEQANNIGDDHICNEDTFTNVTISCIDGFIYSADDSAVKDFDLGCQSMKRTLIGSFHNVGQFISLPLTGYLSDRFGRKFALSVASLMNGIFGVLRSFAPNYTSMLIFEFLETALGAGAYSTAFVLAVEFVNPKGRVFINTMVNVVYVFGAMTLSLLSWWLQDWRVLLRIVYMPALIVVTYYWLLNESVRWLLSKGRSEEAIAILKKAAKQNKVDLDCSLLEPLRKDDSELENKKEELPNSESDQETNKLEKNNFRNVLRSKIIMKRLLCCSFLWITCTFVYYGLSINSVSLAGNKFVNFMLVVLVEIPANMACLGVLDRFGRRKTLASSFIVSGILCISLVFLPKDQPLLSLFFFLGGKFFITLSYSSVYIYVSEVFPTNVRQTLLAFCSSFGRFGSTLAPLTPLLAIYYQNLPSIFFSTMAAFASCVVLLLPETLNQPLPDTIEEAEALSKRKDLENGS